jgi:muramoyltetrapeptide carboxypeptidase
MRGQGAPGPLLRRGDTIDVVAPGFRCSSESLQEGLAYLRRLGLVPRVPRTLFGDDLLCANSDRVRFRHLKKALFAPDSRGIWCVRAGYGAIRLIEPLLALKPPARRKLFIGYSDATTLHFFLNHHWKWPSLHGPLLDRLGSGTVRREELRELEAVLLGTQRSVQFAELTPLNAAARANQTVRGRVFGGNLTVLQTMLGTALERRPRQILFLEDIGERGYRIDRMLRHLAQAGALRDLKALLFGSFVGGQEPDGRNLVVPVLERFGREQPYPVLLGVSAGHGEYQRPLFFNTAALLRCGRAPELSVDVVSRTG